MLFRSIAAFEPYDVEPKVKLPIWLCAAGIVCSFLGVFFVSTKESSDPRNLLGGISTNSPRNQFLYSKNLISAENARAYDFQKNTPYTAQATAVIAKATVPVWKDQRKISLYLVAVTVPRLRKFATTSNTPIS